MGEYLSPGVYVEEMAGPRPIEGASTSTAAFVGYTAKGEVGKAKFVTSFGEYERYFGGFQVGDNVHTPFAVKNFFDEGGSKAYVVRHGASEQEINADLIAYKDCLAIGSAANGLEITTRALGVDGRNYQVEISKGASTSDGEFTLKFIRVVSGNPVYFAAVTGATKQKLKADSASLLRNAYETSDAGVIDESKNIDLNQFFVISNVSNTMNIPETPEINEFDGGIDAPLVRPASSAALEKSGITVEASESDNYAIVVTTGSDSAKRDFAVYKDGVVVPGKTVTDAVVGTNINLDLTTEVKVSGILTSMPLSFPTTIEIVKEGEEVNHPLNSYGLTVEVTSAFQTAEGNSSLIISKAGEDVTFTLTTKVGTDPEQSAAATEVVASTPLTNLSIPEDRFIVKGALVALPVVSQIETHPVLQSVYTLDELADPAVYVHTKTSPELAQLGIDVQVSTPKGTTSPYTYAVSVDGSNTSINVLKGTDIVNSISGVAVGTNLKSLSIADKLVVSGTLIKVPADGPLDIAALNAHGITVEYIELADDVTFTIAPNAGGYNITSPAGYSITTTPTNFGTATWTGSLPTGVSVSGSLSTLPTTGGTYTLPELAAFGAIFVDSSGKDHIVTITINPNKTAKFSLKEDGAADDTAVALDNIAFSQDLTPGTPIPGVAISGFLTALPAATNATFPITGEITVSGEAPKASVGGDNVEPSFEVEAASDGIWANDVTVSVVSTGSEDSSGSQLFTLVVAENGIEVETFEDVTLDKANKKAFITTVVNEKSNYIRITKVVDSNEVAVGTFSLSGGDFYGGHTKDLSIGDLENYLDDFDSISMLVTPDVTTDTGQKDGASYCDKRKDCFFIASTNVTKVTDLQAYKTNLGGMSRCALYSPYLKQTHPATNEIVEIPAAGAVAGIYARTDVNRGVFKAPAGTIDGQVRTALALSHPFSKGEQDMLNPLGINLIRNFPGAGNVIWGTRTTAADAQWRYVPVRRLVMYIEKSIENSIQWSVFEPNDQKLWSQLKREISGFLRGVWKDGGLFGASEDQAFFVKIDEENNPQSSRDAGKLIVNIGVAPVKPAEFVIIRIEQTQSEA